LVKWSDWVEIETVQAFVKHTVSVLVLIACVGLTTLVVSLFVVGWAQQWIIEGEHYILVGLFFFLAIQLVFMLLRKPVTTIWDAAVVAVKRLVVVLRNRGPNALLLA
jgi:hypothetical protein